MSDDAESTSLPKKSLGRWFRGFKCKQFGEKSDAPEIPTITVGSQQQIGEFDPIKFQRVVKDEDAHISSLLRTGQSSNIQFKGTWGPVLKWYRSMKKEKQFMDLIKKTGFEFFLQIEVNNSDRRLAEAIVERWWDTTHTFHLPCGELGLTPLDFSMLTGISVGEGCPVLFDEEYENFETAQKFLGNLSPVDIDNGSIKCTHLEKYKNYCFSLDEKEREMGIRAFIMYLLGEFLFANSNSRIRLGYLASLVEFDNICKYDWGGAALAHLYGSMDATCRMGRVGNNAVVGCWQVLEYWYYSYCNVNMHVRREDACDLFPMINKWGPTNRIKVSGEIRNNLDISRQQIEMRTRDCITWQPWRDSRYLKNSHVRSAYLLAARRCILISPLYHAWYLGERCARQATGEIVVPNDPPVPMNANEFNYNQVLQYYKKNGEFIDNIVHRVGEHDYDAYWRHVSVGYLLPAVYRAANIDIIGVQAVENDVYIRQSVGATLQRGAYLPPEHQDKGHTLQWTVPIITANGQSCDVPIPLVDDSYVVGLPLTRRLPRAELEARYAESLRLNTALKQFFTRATKRKLEPSDLMDTNGEESMHMLAYPPSNRQDICTSNNGTPDNSSSPHCESNACATKDLNSYKHSVICSTDHLVKTEKDSDLGGNSALMEDPTETSSFHFVLIENLEKDLCSSAIVDCVRKHVSITSQAQVFPSLSWESFTRGIIIVDSQDKLQKLSEFLHDSAHIILSSRGRPWAVTEKKLSVALWEQRSET